MKFNTADRETGTIIETFKTREEAVEAIRGYEEDDKKEGTYSPGFYDIVDDDHCSI